MSYIGSHQHERQFPTKSLQFTFAVIFKVQYVHYFIIHRFFRSSTDAVQVQDHVQVAAQPPKAIDRRAKRHDVAFWEIGPCNVLEQGADEEAQTGILLRQLVGLGQRGHLLLNLEERITITGTQW